MNNNQEQKFDALLPPEMAVKAEQVGAAKAKLPAVNMFLLAVLAGGFIGLGAAFATTATTGAGSLLSYGVARVLGGLVFSLGLILVIVGGAELFTGNNLIVMAWASGRVSTAELVRSWGIVYVGNFTGAFGTALLVFLSGSPLFGDGAVGQNALSIAAAKVDYGFGQALILGVLCNVLVCLAVWLSFSARTVTDRILAVIFPITAFVATGFEHSIANMYFIPMGLLIKAFPPDGFLVKIGFAGEQLAGLTWRSFLTRNLLPVTIGNVIGGVLLVGLVYWTIYLRQGSRRSDKRD